MRRLLASLATLALLGSLVVIAPASVSGAGLISQVSRSGVGGPRVGDAPPSDATGELEDEFPGEEGEAEDGDAPADFNGVIDRSLSFGRGAKGPAIAATSRIKSSPSFKMGFEGLNHYQQRYSNRGNQFSLEPPDQGLCVGNGFVLETVNDVMNVFHASDGTSALPDNTATNIVGTFPRDVNHAVDLNSFYGYVPAINRAAGNLRGPFLTDPSCLYDAQTNRWFHVVLTLEVVPTTGAFTFENHLDIAVSQTGNPTGLWNIYSIDVADDGTNTGGNTCGDGNDPCNPGPYLGDYPQIGADANGFYIATNAYPWCCNGFAGAQIYALSKAQLAAGAASVNMVHIDTSGMVDAPSDAGDTQPGFTVWPARSPGAGSFALGNGGTEYFLSSNAADEATHPVAGTGGNYEGDQIVLWTLTNTSSLNTATPSLSFSNKLIGVGDYARAPKQRQPGAGAAPGLDTPQGHCVNDTTTATIASASPGCWRLLFGAEPAHNEVVSTPDAHDTRMQQVMYANGKVWGALDTAVTVESQNRAGISYYIVNPGSGKLALGGYLGASGMDLTYPAIGVTASGRGVMAFTATGNNVFPSAAFAPIDALSGITSWGIVPGGEGQAADDGFTSYKAFVGNPPRTRWGDYGAAAVDGNAIWLASEYVSTACSYIDWGGPFFVGGTGDNLLGTCAGAGHGPGGRTAQANWSTFVSKFTR